MQDNPYRPKPYKVTDFVRETSDNFTLTINMKIKHMPGQFVQVSVPGYGEAPISICSDSKEFIKLNIRQVGNVTNALSKLRKGHTIFLRGPYGKGYPMKELKGKDLIIVGGGCGIAPLKGVIDYVENKRRDYNNIHLFFGYRSPDDIIFSKEVKKWSKMYDFHMTLDKKTHSHLCYDAQQGVITDTLSKVEFNGDNKIALVCGPPIMMKFVIDVLLKKGFTDNQIYISAERLMYCALGVCCHCMIRGKFTCIDGPVFRYDEVKDLQND